MFRTIEEIKNALIDVQKDLRIFRDLRKLSDNGEILITKAEIDVDGAITLLETFIETGGK